MDANKSALNRYHLKYLPEMIRNVADAEDSAAEENAREVLSLTSECDADLEASIHEMCHFYVDVLREQEARVFDTGIAVLNIVQLQAKQSLRQKLDEYHRIEKPEHRASYSQLYKEQEDKLCQALEKAFECAYNRGQSDMPSHLKGR